MVVNGGLRFTVALFHLTLSFLQTVHLKDSFSHESLDKGSFIALPFCFSG